MLNFLIFFNNKYSQRKFGMEDFGMTGFILLILNLIVSYKGFQSNAFFRRHAFWVGKILVYKEWGRLISAGFLHSGWTHLLVNMLVLHGFSRALELEIGILNLFILYGTSLLGGNVLSLYLNRNNTDYRAVGASGAVSGIVFAQIIIAPAEGIGFIGLPLYVPGWLFGLCYMLFCIWGISTRKGNIGHDAHLGGGLAGALLALLLVPGTLSQHALPIVLVLLPALAFLFYIIRNPEFLVIGPSLIGKEAGYQTKDDKYHEEKRRRQQKLDLLLDKISDKGIDSLTKKEKDFLDAWAQEKERR